MGLRRNEMMVAIRSEPMSYRASYTSDNLVEYEGWAEPGAAESSAVWIICKHTYSSSLLTKTEWAAVSGSPAASFDSIWSNRTSLTYV